MIIPSETWVELDGVLLEPEPISVYALVVTEDEDGRDIQVSTLTPLDGVYEIHDVQASSELTGSGARTDIRPLLIGTRDTLLVPETRIKVQHDGPHGGKEYVLGGVQDYGSHYEIPLEDA